MKASGKTTAQETTGLRKIQRERRWIWFWVLSYVPAVWIVRHAIHSNIADTIVILIWAIGFVRSIARGMFSRCPRCNGYFHSARGTPSFFNLLARKCMQCGLPLRADRVIYQSLQ